MIANFIEICENLNFAHIYFSPWKTFHFHLHEHLIFHSIFTELSRPPAARAPPRTRRRSPCRRARRPAGCRGRRPGARGRRTCPAARTWGWKQKESRRCTRMKYHQSLNLFRSIRYLRNMKETVWQLQLDTKILSKFREVVNKFR